MKIFKTIKVGFLAKTKRDEKFYVRFKSNLFCKLQQYFLRYLSLLLSLLWKLPTTCYCAYLPYFIGPSIKVLSSCFGDHQAQ